MPEHWAHTSSLYILHLGDQMEEVKLNNKEQFVVLILATVAGFAANKFTESQVTKFIKHRKS